jgi:polar amino acid transport system permease protein
MDALLQSFFNIDVLAEYWPLILHGLGQTILLSVIVVPLGLLGGIVMAILTTQKNNRYRQLAVFLVNFFRAFPPLVLLILIYSGLPHLGVRLTPLSSVIIAFFLNTSAYYGEVVRAGFLSVPVGQTDAARATGLTYLQTIFYIRLPQAVRNVMPDLLSNTLEVVKLTSIAAVVTYTELTQAARVAQGLSFNATPIIAAALLYFIILWPLVRIISRQERRELY